MFEKIASLLVNPFLIGITISLGLFEEFSPIIIINKLPGYVWFIIAGILYSVSVTKGFIRQLDYTDDTFDLNALKRLYPDLYEQFHIFKNTEPFSFEMLHSEFEDLSEGSAEATRIALKLVESESNENSKLTKRLSEAEELLNEMTLDTELNRNLFEKSITALQAVNKSEVTKDVLHFL